MAAFFSHFAKGRKEVLKSKDDKNECLPLLKNLFCQLLLDFTVQNDVCIALDTLRLFSHPSLG